MPIFSKLSLDKLATVDRRLYDICTEVIKVYDFTVICGHRNEQDQNKAVESGKSKTQWPTSRHNSSPSQAVDLAPYPIEWSDLERFKELNSHMQTAAAKLGIEIEWGGDFKTLADYDHWQLKA